MDLNFYERTIATFKVPKIVQFIGVGPLKTRMNQIVFLFNSISPISLNYISFKVEINIFFSSKLHCCDAENEKLL